MQSLPQLQPQQCNSVKQVGSLWAMMWKLSDAGLVRAALLKTVANDWLFFCYQIYFCLKYMCTVFLTWSMWKFLGSVWNQDWVYRGVLRELDESEQPGVRCMIQQHHQPCIRTDNGSVLFLTTHQCLQIASELLMYMLLQWKQFYATHASSGVWITFHFSVCLKFVYQHLYKLEVNDVCCMSYLINSTGYMANL